LGSIIYDVLIIPALELRSNVKLLKTSLKSQRKCSYRNPSCDYKVQNEGKELDFPFSEEACSICPEPCYESSLQFGLLQICSSFS